MSRVSKSRMAFTLVELLVVIGIIALLISILLPALGRANQAAKQVKCMAGMRVLGQCGMLYATENRGFFAVGGTNYGANGWQAKLATYTMKLDAQKWWETIGLPAANAIAGGGELKIANTVYTCPSLRDPTSSEAIVSFKINAYLAEFGGFIPNNDASDIPNEKVNPNRPKKITAFREPSKKVWLAEGITTQSNLRTRWFCNNRTDPSFGLLDVRHMKNTKIDILYLDGHSNSVSVKSIPKDFAQAAQTKVNSSQWTAGDLWLKPEAPSHPDAY